MIPKNPTSQNTRHYWEDARLSITTFCLCIAGVFVGVYIGARTGFDVALLPMLRFISVTGFILLSPVGYRTLQRRLGWQYADTWLNSDGFIMLMAVIVAVLMGKMSAIIGFSLHPIIGLLFFLFLAIFAMQWLRFKSVWWRIKMALGAVGIGIFLASAVWGLTPHGSAYLNPLFMERLVAEPKGLDTLFHADVANMMLTYQQASTGLHGVPYLAYHYASHWLFGGLSQLIDVDILGFYQIQPILFYPLFIYALMLFGCRLRLWFGIPRLLSEDRWVWLFLPIGLIGVFPYYNQLNVGILWDRYVSSESYLLALTVLFILMNMILIVIERVQSLKKVPTSIDLIAIFLVIPAIAVLIGFLKISVLFVFMCAYGYAFIKLGWYRSVVMLIGFGVACGVSFWTYRTVEVSNFVEVEPFAYITRYVGFANIPIWFVMFAFFLLVYMAMRLYDMKLRSWADWRTAWTSHRLIDVELLLIIMLCGLFPGMVLDIPTWTAGYFSDVQHWIAIGLLLAFISPFMSQHRLWGWIRSPRLHLINKMGIGVVVTIITLFLCIFLLINITHMVANMVLTNVSIRQTIAQNQIPIMPHFDGVFQPIPLSVVNEGDRRIHTNYITLIALRQLAQLPMAQKSNTLVYIPKENTAYWGWMPCHIIPLAAPAITGIAMVEGNIQQGCPVEGYGYSLYEGINNLSQMTTTQLCQTVKSLGFEQAIRLDTTTDMTLMATNITCGESDYPTQVLFEYPLP